LIVGGIYLDHLARGAVLPGPGETLRASAFLQAPGGKGANQAVAAARLGASVAMVGRVGNDEAGPRLLGALAAEGIDTTFVHLISGGTTGTAVVQVDEHGEKQILAIPGVTATVPPEQIDGALDHFPHARVLVTQLETGIEVAGRIIRHGHGRGAVVILDPSPADPIPDDLLRQVDLIKPDASEARLLTGIEVHDRASARRAAHQLIRRGARAVLTQAGDQGDLLVTQTVEHWLPRHRIDAVDATGAGDAMVGVLAARLAEGRPLIEAARWASAAAALATTAFGAQTALPTHDAIEALLERSQAAMAGS
jgi:ribokinase